MKFGDIIKAILIIIIFGLLYFSTILTSGLQDIKDNWPQYRCVPTYMPLAGFLGFDTASNFAYCVGNIQKDMMGFFLQPIQYVLGITGGLANWIISRIQFIRVFIKNLKSMVGNLVGDVYGMMVNVLVQFQKLIIKTKDTIMKLIGTLVTFVYLIQGAMMTGKSINKGPIGETLRAICFHADTKIKLKNGKFKTI